MKHLDIQALRGIAVLAVMLSHFNSILPAGFIGVDIFFAISGFVIFLSLKRLAQKSVSMGQALKEFWTRRFWRLAPAAFTVIAVTLFVALMTLPPSDFSTQRAMALWSLFSAANIGVEVSSQASYFEITSSENWFLHLWSLGVEEQFYLLFPFLVVPFLLSKRGSRRRFPLPWIIGSLAFLSLLMAFSNEIESYFFGTSFLQTETGVSAVLGYYSPVTRWWQFGLGVLAALYVEKKGRKPSSLSATVALAVLTAALAFTPESELLPGPVTLAPMLATFLLLTRPIPPKLMNLSAVKLLIWLGDRSYSAYLWHWPVWSTLSLSGMNPALKVTSAIVTTLWLANISLKFLERPLVAHGSASTPAAEHNPNPNSSPIRSFGGILAAVLLLGILAPNIVETLRSVGIVRKPQQISRVSPSIDCFLSDCAPGQVDILLVGDSHAGAIADSLHKEFAAAGTTLRSAVMSGCLHVPNKTVTSTTPDCQAKSHQVLEMIDRLAPSRVILFGYTAGRFTEINSGGDSDIQLVYAGGDQIITASNSTDAYADALIDFSEFLGKRAIPLTIISGTPDFDYRPEEVGRNGRSASTAEIILGPLLGLPYGQVKSKPEFLLRNNSFRQAETALERRDPWVTIFDPWNVVCAHAVCAQVDNDGEVIFSDEDHLAPVGATKLSRELVKAFGVSENLGVING